MAIFSTAVTDITREEILPKAYDIVLNGSPVVARVIGNGKKWRSGYKLDTIVDYKKSTQGGWSAIGAQLNTARENTTARMTFDPKRITQPVVVDQLEVAVNQGEQRVIELVALEMDKAIKTLNDNVGDSLYTGTGSGVNPDSLKNAADDATSFSTYGSLARATYSGLNGYLSTSVGSLALSDMTTAFDAVEHGNKAPTLAATTPTVWTAYEALLQPTVNANYAVTRKQIGLTGGAQSGGGLVLTLGAVALEFRGIPLVKDEKATSGTMWFIDETYFNWYGIDIPGAMTVKYSGKNIDSSQEVPKSVGFGFTGMKEPYDYLAEIGHIHFHGNFISENPRQLGQLTGVTA